MWNARMASVNDPILSWIRPRLYQTVEYKFIVDVGISEAGVDALESLSVSFRDLFLEDEVSFVTFDEQTLPQIGDDSVRVSTSIKSP